MCSEVDTSTIEELSGVSQLLASLKNKSYRFYFPVLKMMQGLIAALSHQRQGWHNSQMSNKAKVAKRPLAQCDMW